jgi:predicted transcriptional regulator
MGHGGEEVVTMAKRGMEKHVTMVGCRVTPELAQKLADLAKATNRDMAGVLRHLIAHAEVRQPDIASVVAGIGAGAGEPHAAQPA